LFVAPESAPALVRGLSKSNRLSPEKILCLRGVISCRSAHGMTQRRHAAATIPPFSKQLIPAIAVLIFRARGPAMTRDETVALFLECEAKRGEARAAALAEGKSEDEARETAHEAAKAHWNAWAEPLLAERKAMEQSGAWAAEKKPWGSIEAKNEETRAWMERADAHFSRCLYLVRGAEWTKEAAGEDKDKPEASDPPVKSIAIDDVRIDMRGFAFPGAARFDSATFSGDARFDSATFSGDARFDIALFSGGAGFGSATFSGDARFDIALFSGGAGFGSATFSSYAGFDSATFSGDAWFESATFSGDAWFESATFSGDAWFDNATFKSSASYRACRFHQEVTFTGIRAEKGFDFIGVRSRRYVPDFLSAMFEEPPLLDNFRLSDEVEPGGLARSVVLGFSAWLKEDLDSALSAKYRRLKQLAIDAEDHKNEQVFFRGELRSRRYLEDKPWHPAFWLGIAYEVLSDFGFSVLRPLLVWLACVVFFAAFYLSQTDAMRRDLALRDASVIGAAAQAGRHALSNDVACYPPPPTFTENWKLWHSKEAPPAAQSASATLIRGLGEKLRAQTSANAEARHLAFRNGLVALDGGGDASYRIYGCLYGLEGNAPIVPAAVSTASAIQKVLSALLIFLFGLALRNMLKVK
jgi:hypothetical protein